MITGYYHEEEEFINIDFKNKYIYLADEKLMYIESPVNPIIKQYKLINDNKKVWVTFDSDSLIVIKKNS